MSRPVTLFTGQWADLKLEDLCRKASQWGYDGLELACWGDHFDVQQALNEDGYVEGRWELLQQNDMVCYAISNHLVGQAVCDNIDERHQSILSPVVWGDGDPEGVRQRAAQEMIATQHVIHPTSKPTKSPNASRMYILNMPQVTNSQVM